MGQPFARVPRESQSTRHPANRCFEACFTANILLVLRMHPFPLWEAVWKIPGNRAIRGALWQPRKGREVPGDGMEQRLHFRWRPGDRPRRAPLFCREQNSADSNLRSCCSSSCRRWGDERTYLSHTHRKKGQGLSGSRFPDWLLTLPALKLVYRIYNLLSVLSIPFLGGGGGW